MTTTDYAKMTQTIDDLTEDLEDMTASNQNNEIEVERLSLLLNETKERVELITTDYYNLYDKIDEYEKILKETYYNFNNVIDSKKMKRNLRTELKVLVDTLRRYNIEF